MDSESLPLLSCQGWDPLLWDGLPRHVWHPVWKLQEVHHRQSAGGNITLRWSSQSYVCVCTFRVDFTHWSLCISLPALAAVCGTSSNSCCSISSVVVFLFSTISVFRCQSASTRLSEHAISRVGLRRNRHVLLRPVLSLVVCVYIMYSTSSSSFCLRLSTRSKYLSDILLNPHGCFWCFWILGPKLLYAHFP